MRFEIARKAKRLLLGETLKNKRDFRERLSELGEHLQLIIGAGSTDYPGWLSTDIRQLNILKEKDWHCFKGKMITNILAEHVWEHLSLKDARIANLHCYKYLADKGKLRIAVPDGFFPDSDYIDYVKPGGTGAGADDHKVLYNYKLMQAELEKAGFKVELLEYWDEEGVFHFNPWEVEEGGMVGRSKRFDERNAAGQLNYTSLIVDAIKD